jgi:Zn-dependent protease
MSFSVGIGKAELGELMISLVVLTVAFAVMGEKQLPSADIFLMSALGVGTGFILHELAHKFMAQRYGYIAQYRASWGGLALLVIMSVMVGFIFAAPGAVEIRRKEPIYGKTFSSYGDGPAIKEVQKDIIEMDEARSKREMLWIAMAGPMTNIVLAIIFFWLGMSSILVSSLWQEAAFFAVFINMILAAFNLLPVNPLDGGKVFQGSRLIWAVVGLPVILVTIVVVFGLM